MLVPWTAVVVYTFFSFVLGQNGLYARKHLEMERQRLLENQQRLEYARDDFIKTKDTLVYDQDALSVYTRQLGYGTGDEKFVRIKGLGVAVNANMPAGQVLYAAAPAFVPDKTIKLISAFFGLTVLIFFLINDFFVLKEMFQRRAD